MKIAVNIMKHYPMPGDKVLPFAQNIEEILFGSILLKSEATEHIFKYLNPEIFYNQANRKIFEAILNLNKQNKSVDIFIVTDQKRHTNDIDIVGGPYVTAQSTSRIVPTANNEHHLRILLEKSMQRSLVHLFAETISKIVDDDSDPFNIADNAEKSIKQMRENIGIGISIERIGQVMKQAHDALKKRLSLSREGKTIGIDTRLAELNKITGGWQKSGLIILAGRPGSGKTSLMMHFVLAAAKSSIPVSVFSLEMSSVTVADKLIAATSEIDVQYNKEGTLRV